MTEYIGGDERVVPMWLQEVSRFQRLKDLRLAVPNEAYSSLARSRVRSHFYPSRPSNAFYHPFAIKLYQLLSSPRIQQELDFMNPTMGFEELYFEKLQLWLDGNEAFERWLGTVELAACD